MALLNKNRWFLSKRDFACKKPKVVWIIWVLTSQITFFIFVACLAVKNKIRDSRCKNPDSIMDIWILTCKITISYAHAFIQGSQLQSIRKTVILGVRNQPIILNFPIIEPIVSKLHQNIFWHKNWYLLWSGGVLPQNGGQKPPKTVKTAKKQPIFSR